MKTVNVSKETHHALKMHCANTQCQLKDVIERFIRDGIKRDNERLNVAAEKTLSILDKEQYKNRRL